jgi:hypothetical protein
MDELPRAVTMRALDVDGRVVHVASGSDVGYRSGRTALSCS